MKTAVIGSGAIGSLVAAYLSTRLPEIVLYERPGRRAEQLTREGLRVTGLRGDFHLRPHLRVDGLADTPFDLVFVCVKAHQTLQAAEDHHSLIGPRTLVVSLQNGIGNIETLAECWPQACHCAATTTLGAYLDESGQVHHVGEGDTFLGALHKTDEARAAEWVTRLSSELLPVVLEPDITRLLFVKLAVNCVINPLTALLDQPNGLVARDADLSRLAGEIVEELVTVAAAGGVELCARELLARALEVSRRTARNRSSMLNDVRRGLRTEIEAINGAVVRLGAAAGIPTPVNLTLTCLIRSLERKPQA